MIFAVMMVRNEADVLPVNLRYHLGSGIDHILAIDNGSTDGTMRVLEEFRATKRVHPFSRPGAFHQAEITTEFAREAFLRGAHWVLPIDADEFWYAPGGQLRDVLSEAVGIGALEVDVLNFVQDRTQLALSPDALQTMTRRVPEPIGASGEAAELVESGRISFVQCRYPSKYVSRASIALEIAQGNHRVSGIDGPISKTTGIVCLHAPLRAKTALERQKVEQGRRVEEVNQYLQQAWHIRRWRRLADEGGLDAEWTANSYSDDYLDVGGVKHPLVFDPTLRDVVSPWLDAAADLVPRAPLPQPHGARKAQTIAELDANTRAAILDSVASVEGWLRPEEAAVLIEGTRRAVAGQGDLAVVEIGSYCGKSTIALAGAARTANDSARVYAIDPHEGLVGSEGTPNGLRTELPTFERFCRNLSAAGLSEMVVPIRRRSYEVEWHLPIGFLFVDGLHDYLSVARDFYHFEPHLADGAYVAFHDCDDTHPGVRTFVAGLAASGCYEQVERAGSLVVFHRVESRTHEPRSSDPNSWIAMNLRLSRQEKGIVFLMGELASRNRTIQERDEGIEWLRTVVRDKESTIAGLENGVEWLQKELANRDVLISALRHDLEAVRQKVSRPDAPAAPWPLTQPAPDDSAG